MLSGNASKNFIPRPKKVKTGSAVTAKNFIPTNKRTATTVLREIKLDNRKNPPYILNTNNLFKENKHND